MKKIKYKYLQGSIPENTEWWTDKDWDAHKKLVETLKETGEYLKEVEVEIHYMSYPKFDEPTGITANIRDNSSYRFVFLNLKSNL